MNFIKRLFKKCEHDFRQIDTLVKVYPNYDTNRYESNEYYVLYCPKCDKEKRINSDKYERELKKKKLKNQYG